MILTNCAACAAPLAHDAPRCVRCWTRYCCAACLNNHAHRGGHSEEICAEKERAGGAEQYNANQKCTEAVAVAVAKCADDTKGQTCFICMEAVHWKTKEGLVRGCACRGAAGVVHVSCLAEQAKILVAEAEANNLDDKVWNERWKRWTTCRLCEQRYHGVVRCALGWACWTTYVGRPEADPVRLAAMHVLGIGLRAANHLEDARSVQEADLSTMRRLGESSEDVILVVQSSLAITYSDLGRLEESLRMKREVYSGRLKLFGEEHADALQAANNYATSLYRLQRFEEAKSVMRKMTPVARRALGDSHALTLMMRCNYAAALYKDAGATLDDVREAVTTLEETERIGRRVFSGSHPYTAEIETCLRFSRAALRRPRRRPW